MSALPSFFETEQSIEDLFDAYESIAEEELTEELQEAFEERLSELADTEEAKIDGIGRFVKLETARAEAEKAEGLRLAAKGKARLAKVARVKLYYLQEMERNRLRKVSGRFYSLSVRDSKTVVIDNAEELPKEYVNVKTEVTPNKLLLKEVMSAGEVVPGAHIGVSTSLQIR